MLLVGAAVMLDFYACVENSEQQSKEIEEARSKPTRSNKN
jgi:hypothetical protein